MCLKAVKINNDDKNNNDYNIKINKNTISGNRIYNYKIKGDNQKIVKNEKYPRNMKININGDDEEENESNNSKLINDNDNIDDYINKNKTINFKDTSNTELYLDLIYNGNEKSEFDSKNNNINIFHSFNSESESNNNLENNENYQRNKKRINTVDVRDLNHNDKNTLKKYYKDYNDFIRKTKRDYTFNLKFLVKNHDFSKIEEQFNSNKNKLRYKKAKIRKFKPNKDDFEYLPFAKRKKGYLYQPPNDKNDKYESNTQLKDYGKKDASISYLNKNQMKKQFLNKSNKNSDYENNDFYIDKYSQNFSGNKSNKKKKKIKNISQKDISNDNNNINKIPSKSKILNNKQFNTINNQSFKKRKIINTNRKNVNNINNIQSKLTKNNRERYHNKSNSVECNLPKATHINRHLSCPKTSKKIIGK